MASNFVLAEAPPAACDPQETTCAHMTSCEEVTRYLKQCGQTKLDRNHDGVPCESLCNPNKKKKAPSPPKEPPHHKP